MARRPPVSLVLDTCALLALADGELSPAAAAALRQAPEAYVSSVSAWEVAIKVAAGTLRLREAPAGWFLSLLERYELREVPLDAVTACAAAGLPAVHRDPFDRVLVVLALSARLTVLTSDGNIGRYPGIDPLW
jgi:PIN domain nuclease of toxin-antitoxin system